MLAFYYCCVYIGTPFLYLLRAHHGLHGVLNPTHVALSLFLLINVLICLWEMTLFISRKLIKQQYEEFKKKWGKDSLPSPMFLFDHVSFKDATGMEYWSRVWSTYSLLDPSYSDQTTFGFWIDVGNGFTTILPSIHLLLSMSYNLPSPFGLSPRSTGLLSLIFFWQELYGTIIYFSSYVMNKRYVGKQNWHIWVVIVANGIWILGPALGMWSCVRMAHENRWDVFRT